MRDEKIKSLDIEIEDMIWVKEFNQYLIVKNIDFTINGKSIITFENGKTLLFNKTRKFNLM